MKKIFSIIALLSLTLTVSAQRYGVATGRDNTGRVLTYGDISKTDAASATVDTITTSLTNSMSSRGFYHTYVYFSLSDSCVFSFSSVSNCVKGDRLTVIIQNTIASAASFVNFLGYSGLTSKWKMASTGTKVTLAASKWATLEFVFDGTYWHELSRAVQ